MRAVLLLAGVLATRAAASDAQEAVRPSFSEFLAGIRAEALMHGIKEETLDAALSNIEEPLPIVLERDRTQAETVLPLEKYLARLLTARLSRAAQDASTKHHAVLDAVAGRYGVPPEIIVAIWGIESNFGRFSGIRPTVAALATLAWDPRRSTLFRNELFAALTILDHGDIDVPRMRGSWAGAMGQVQFMPSSYLQYAEDFDGDGRRDIWSSPADIFASVANYLKGHGWSNGESWGREVRVSKEAAKQINTTVPRREGTCRATRDMTAVLPISEWQRLGVRPASGSELPSAAVQAAMVSGASRHFLVFHNYDALLDYNCAHSYAVSVGLLADRLGSPSAVALADSKPKPTKKPGPRRRTRR
jgi:membrane-bound lytic murein transglycosylase B